MQNRTCPYIEVAQVQKEPLDRLLAVFGGKVSFHKRKNAKAEWSDFYRWTLYGNKAAGMMMTLFKLMSPKRKDQIEVVVSAWIKRGKRGSHHRNMTHCKAGHEYIEGSWTRKGENGRQCKICMNTYRAAYAARKEQ